MWACNLPSSRIVSLHHRPDQTAGPSAPEGEPCGGGRFVSSATIPANLHACRESRAEALRVYRLLLGSAFPASKIFFSPRRDILYFGARSDYHSSRTQLATFLERAPRDQLAQVRRLAINAAAVWDANTTRTVSTVQLMECLRWVLERLSHLEELIFVRHDENPVYSPESIFIDPNGGDVRLKRRLLEGIRNASHSAPASAFPPWKIMDISAVPTPLQTRYDESILGYASMPRGAAGESEENPAVAYARTRTRFFQRAMLLKLEELERSEGWPEHANRNSCWHQQPLVTLSPVHT